MQGVKGATDVMATTSIKELNEQLQKKIKYSTYIHNIF